MSEYVLFLVSLHCNTHVCAALKCTSQWLNTDIKSALSGLIRYLYQRSTFNKWRNILTRKRRMSFHRILKNDETPIFTLC